MSARESSAAPELVEKLAPVSLQAENATIYHRGSFNYRRMEVRRVEVSVGKYAQYERALLVQFVEKGKRKALGMWLTYRPQCVILAGHGHPIPADAMEDRGGGCSMSRHSSHAEEWGEEFDAMIAPYLAEHPSALLADYRGFDTQSR